MTIKEIARQLNLSISTVSKALSGATDISNETRKTVLQYAEKVGYRAKNKSQNIRVCVMYEQDDNTKKYNVLHEIITAFLHIAHENGIEVVIDSLSQKPDNFSLNDYLGVNNFNAAFLVGINFESKVFKQLKHTEYPLVLLDNHIPAAELVSSVSSDNISAMEKAVAYLNKMGHTKIGFLSGESQSMVCAERLAGFILGLARAGTDFNSNHLYYGDFTRESGLNSARFFAETDVTAVICCSDIMAMGLIDGLKNIGKSVPHDISVIGFDDLNILNFTNYGLTTMKQDFVALGEKSYSLMLDLLNGRSAQRVILPCRLVERGSVKNIGNQ